MQLLQKIIDILSDEKGSLTDALLKTKIVLHKIGQKELVQWVNNELNGYPSDADVPEYRVIASGVHGIMRSFTAQYNNHALPILHLTKKQQESMTRRGMHQSIAVLEQFAASKSPLTSELGPEWYPRFNEALVEGLGVHKAWIETQPTMVLNALVEIRSRLLDFMLNLQTELGDVEGDAEVKEAAKKIDAAGMFHGAVIGDNATIVIGDHNTTNIKNEVKHGDFESLAAVLRKNKVAESDIIELQTAVSADQGVVDVPNKQPGPAVKGWMSRMLTKAVETSWSIELGVAGNLLTDAIKAFYF